VCNSRFCCKSFRVEGRHLKLKIPDTDLSWLQQRHKAILIDFALLCVAIFGIIIVAHSWNNWSEWHSGVYATGYEQGFDHGNLKQYMLEKSKVDGSLPLTYTENITYAYGYTHGVKAAAEITNTTLPE
jgi:hypothetical protein